MSTPPQQPMSPLPLIQIATGFMAAKTLFTAHELDLFSVLSRSGGASPKDVAGELGIAERPVEMLLTGCAGLGLLAKHDGRYVNSPLAEAYLVKGKPTYFGGFLAFNDKRAYGTWGRLIEAVRTNRPIDWDSEQQRAFLGDDASVTVDFYEALHALSTPTGRALAGVVDFAKSHRLLDLGGGSAAIDIEVCRAHPHLRATVFDLPPAVKFATMKIVDAGYSDRIEAVSGDLFGDAPYPSGHDAILLSLVLHSFRPDRVEQVLRRCYECLPSGGRILITELMVDDDKSGPAPAALMSLTMLVEEEGRNYTAAEYGQWLTGAGFRDIQRLPMQAFTANGVLVATKA